MSATANVAHRIVRAAAGQGNQSLEPDAWGHFVAAM
jgi:hypothetical protein